MFTTFCSYSSFIMWPSASMSPPWYRSFQTSDRWAHCFVPSRISSVLRVVFPRFVSSSYIQPTFFIGCTAPSYPVARFHFLARIYAHLLVFAHVLAHSSDEVVVHPHTTSFSVSTFQWLLWHLRITSFPDTSISSTVGPGTPSKSHFYYLLYLERVTVV